MTYTFGPGFWSGIIYILFVATFMTIFELLFFTIFIGPKETKIANDYLKEMKKPSYDINYVKNAIGSVIVADDILTKIKTMNLQDKYILYLSCASSNVPINESDIKQFNPSSYIISTDNSYAILSYTNEESLNNALKNKNTLDTSCPVKITSLYDNETNIFKNLMNSDKISEHLHGLLNVSIERENILNSKINQDAIAFICLEIIILILIIGILWAMLKSSNTPKTFGYSEYWNSFKTGITPSLFSALICSLILIIFQISMYKFGTEFNYPEDNELKYRIITKIKTDLNL